MRRIILLLAATALMVVLTATTVSPAFGQGRGYKLGQEDEQGEPYWCGNEEKCKESWGYACGAVRQEKKESAYPC
jgi:hypothetical protein